MITLGQDLAVILNIHLQGLFGIEGSGQGFERTRNTEQNALVVYLECEDKGDIYFQFEWKLLGSPVYFFDLCVNAEGVIKTHYNLKEKSKIPFEVRKHVYKMLIEMEITESTISALAKDPFSEGLSKQLGDIASEYFDNFLICEHVHTC